MTVAELLDFLAPGVAGMDPAIKAQAIEIAELYRPACLPEEKQDMAVALYAAWLLTGIKAQQSGAGGGSIDFPAGATEVKEGDLRIRFSADGAGNGVVVDPKGFLARYHALADLCGKGAITVGDAFPVSGGCGCHG